MEDIHDNDTLTVEPVTKETEVAYLSYQNNVLTVTVKENVDISVEKMKDLLKTAVEIAAFKKYFVIVDGRADFQSAAEVREYYSNNEYSKYRYADAFVINSLAMRLLVNFYISFNKPSIPTKTFTDPGLAKEWIHTMKQSLN